MVAIPGQSCSRLCLNSATRLLPTHPEKRLRGIDIPRHRRHRPGDEGEAAYAGTRQVGGQSLALLRKSGKQGDEIIVMPVGEATA